jgi:type I restriction enzyme S subunit
LEGLEISILNFNDVKKSTQSFRTDAEYYQKLYLNDDKVILKHGFNLLKGVTNKIDVGYVGSMVEHYRKRGTWLLQTKNINSFFINKNNTIYITDKFHRSLSKSQVNYEDILIARSGSFGKASIYLEKEVINSSDIILLSADKSKINSYFLVSFLNSKFGVNQMLRFASGGLQGHVNLTILEELQVPKMDNDFQIQIENTILSSYSKKKSSQQKYEEAENLLLETLGLQNFQPSLEAVNIKSFKESFATTGRLDAEYYQPKYEDYLSAIVSKSHTFIKNEYIQIKDFINRDLEEYNYIEIGDINVGDGMSFPHKVLLEDLPANGKLKAKKGDLLISKVRPYRGAVSIVDNNFENLVVSGAFTVLRSNENSKYNNEVLKVLLRSTLYKDWLLQFNVGTSYPVIKDEDILNLPIPFIEEELQEQIATLIQESFTLKAQSAHLLEVAKGAVEIAIEENEKVAMEYINKNNI